MALAGPRAHYSGYYSVLVAGVAQLKRNSVSRARSTSEHLSKDDRTEGEDIVPVGAIAYNYGIVVEFVT